MQNIMGIENPRVAIVNIGAEEEKGNALVKETFPLLKECKDINFVGSVEARDIPKGEVDVVVCEAFVGNVILKLYEGVGGTKKWERLESYGPKFVENIVQALSRDILCYAMKTLHCCNIVAHVHDEIIIEADPKVSLDAVCEQMGRTPPWAEGLILRADGYETQFYKKD